MFPEEPDWIDEADKWLDRNPEPEDRPAAEYYWIIVGLRQVIKDEIGL